MKTKIHPKRHKGNFLFLLFKNKLIKREAERKTSTEDFGFGEPVDFPDFLLLALVGLGFGNKYMASTI